MSKAPPRKKLRQTSILETLSRDQLSVEKASEDDTDKKSTVPVEGNNHTLHIYMQF